MELEHASEWVRYEHGSLKAPRANVQDSTKLLFIDFQAQFDFEATKPDELTLKVGDIIRHVYKHGRWTNGVYEGFDGWCRGTLDGKSGIFPLRYVRQVKVGKSRSSENLYAMDTDGEVSTFRCRVEFDRQAEKPNQLTLKKGDIIHNVRQAGWWEGGVFTRSNGWLNGTLNERWGVFPENFVKMVSADNSGPTANPSAQLQASKPTVKVKKTVKPAASLASRTSRLQGDFKVHRLLGAGAFGAVLQCTNLLDRKSYAVKVADIDGGNALREVQNWVRVPTHENLVQYITCWEDGFSVQELQTIRQTLRNPSIGMSHEMFRVPSGQDQLRVLCIQMELCEHDLRKWLSQNRAVNEEQSMSIFIQLTKGLEHLHAHAVLHRDLKPENVFLVKADTGAGSLPKVKIGDLGIATTHAGSTRAVMHTHGVGTPLYLAPEQGTSRYGKPADLFALGLIFFELLHPRIQPAANGGSCDALIERFNDLKYQRKVPPQIKSRWPKASELILRLTALDPKDRPNCGQILATFTSK